MPERKKVLLLTYYWPPAGGAGVQRWLQTSTYLVKHFDVTVYHPQNADYPIIDESLLEKIPTEIKQISQPIREPYAMASRFNSKNADYQKGQIEEKEKRSLLSKLSLWIRANWFIPDARAWWIMPSFKFLNQFMKEHPQDVIITTGPPHSVHIIGLRLKLRHPHLKWLADFRDPWTSIDYFDKLPMRSSAIQKHAKLEKEVLKYADAITTVSPSWAQELTITARKPVKTIYNGFDRQDFKKEIHADDQFVITYIGSLNDDRNPSELWKVLEEVCKKNEFRNQFILRLIGNISPHVKNEISQYPHLSSKTEFLPFIPHQEAIVMLQRSQILLLLINETPNEKGIIPSKFFEYLAANRRILCLGNPDSDIAQIMQSTNAGTVIERHNADAIAETIKIWFKEFENDILNQSVHRNTSKFSRKNAAFEFIDLIENF
ncbi:MAG: glycosyltransferase [Flavobacteriaceae bacterium]|nr:glycosyltransferase [Flavobacteriaceae bacterium]